MIWLLGAFTMLMLGFEFGALLLQRPEHLGHKEWSANRD